MKEPGPMCSVRETTPETMRGCEPGAGSVVRAEIEVRGIDVLGWFSRQRGVERFYWSSRDGDDEAAGAGAVAWACDAGYATGSQALAAIQERLNRGPRGLRYYGGMCFDPRDKRPAMEGFGRFRFFAPEVELRRTADTTVLAVTRPAEDARSLSSRLRALSHEATQTGADAPTSGPVGRILSRTDTPDEQAWARMVALAIETMGREQIGKIVLSRKSRLTMSRVVDVAVLLERLRKDPQRAYDFCFEFGGRAFTGSSPECLYRRSGRDICTEALAGTCGVGVTERETRDLRAALRASAKEAEEHGYVFDDIRSQLHDICAEYRVLSERDVLTLSHVQHFVSRFEGRLKDGIGAAEVIAALHPTAAVGGCPQQAALEQIRRIEGHGRRWYAGPVGWLGRDEDEFAVGIRSCVVDGRTLTLYAGAGIVGASDAAAEWAETEAKMRHFLEALA